MQISWNRVALTGAGLTLLTTTLVVRAGDLTPPAGPIAPTMKTIEDAEPRVIITAADLPLTISSPGSFYLGDSIATAGAGIIIDSGDVTIDLNGFSLTGGAGDGVSVAISAPPHRNITIRSGSVTGWSQDGVDAGNAIGCRAIDVQVTLNGAVGIQLGDLGSVENCIASENGGVGILAGSASTITGCTAYRNTGDGIEAGSACRLIANNCVENGFNGDGAGIHITGSGNRLEDNNAVDNDRGIEFGFQGDFTAGNRNFLVRNSVTGAPGGVEGNYVFHPLGVQSTFGELLNFVGGGEINAGNSSPWANFEY